MSIEHERPEDELHTDRVSELLTVVALVFEATGGEPGAGVIECPVCKGKLSYSVLRHGGGNARRAMSAKCARPGCIKFMS